MNDLSTAVDLSLVLNKKTEEKERRVITKEG
jgi:hypothetical protein